MVLDRSVRLHTQSPLYLAMRNPVLHRFISYLADKKAEQEHDPSQHIKIELSQEFIAEVRDAYRQSILDGERLLHVLAHLLAGKLFGQDFELHSNVIGVLPGNEGRPFHIRERITRKTLFSVMDLDLGNQLLNNFRYRQGEDWVPLKLSANYVEYLPVSRTENGVNRVTSRVKAEQELWTKVADEIFGLDHLVSRDKHLRQYSKYVKDIFGVKIVCGDESTCSSVHDQLMGITPAELDWKKLGLPHNDEAINGDDDPSQALLEFVETKDYLTCPPEQMKKTGWKALKSVVNWRDRLFEIQVQPLSNYYLEIDHMAEQSHSSFKLVRDSLRDEVARRIPLYGFYRDLLKMLFMEGEGQSVCFESANASVVIH
jgi:ppGpp synthetase/RelA/SpoT-type nucleotidyltranferase